MTKDEKRKDTIMKSFSESYKNAGVDITAGYRAVELMKAHISRTKNEGCLDDIGGSADASDFRFREWRSLFSFREPTAAERR